MSSNDTKIKRLFKNAEWKTIELLASWYHRTKCQLLIVSAPLFLLLFGILLQVPNLSDWTTNVLFMAQSNSLFFQIFAPGVFILVLFLVVLLTGWDFLSWSFRAIEEFVDPEEWYNYETLENLEKKLSDSQLEPSKAEIILLKEIPFEIKYFVLRLSLRLVGSVFIFIVSFAEIFNIITKVSNGLAFEEGSGESLFWHVFYSLDVVTSLGGAAPTPLQSSVFIWIFSGIELALTIVFILVLLTLSIASVYEVFNLKTTFFSAYVQALRKQN